MHKIILASVLVAGTLVPPISPLAARGPEPAPEPVACNLDISGRWQCAYTTKAECTAALRALRPEHHDVSGCWLSTADPDWWHYGLYVLQYWP